MMRLRSSMALARSAVGCAVRGKQLPRAIVGGTAVSENQSSGDINKKVFGAQRRNLHLTPRELDHLRLHDHLFFVIELHKKFFVSGLNMVLLVKLE